MCIRDRTPLSQLVDHHVPRTMDRESPRGYQVANVMTLLVNGDVPALVEVEISFLQSVEAAMQVVRVEPRDLNQLLRVRDRHASAFDGDRA